MMELSTKQKRIIMEITGEVLTATKTTNGLLFEGYILNSNTHFKIASIIFDGKEPFIQFDSRLITIKTSERFKEMVLVVLNECQTIEGYKHYLSYVDNKVNNELEAIQENNDKIKPIFGNFTCEHDVWAF